MSAPARFHTLLKRLFGRRVRPDTEPAALSPSRPRTPEATDSMPLFSLGESKQELVASYRNLESESA